MVLSAERNGNGKNERRNDEHAESESAAMANDATGHVHVGAECAGWESEAGRFCKKAPEEEGYFESAADLKG